MAEEVSPESKLYVKEEIEKSRKEIKEEVEKVNSKATKTFTIVALVVGLLTGLGVYGNAKYYIKTALEAKLGTETVAEIEENRIQAENSYNKIVEYETKANNILSSLPYDMVIGTIVPYGGKIPEKTLKVGEGWLFCNGVPLDRKEYEELFQVIGTAFGAPDGNTFNLPDLRGRFVRGVDHKTGRDPDVQSRYPSHGGNTGDKVGSLQNDEFYKHQHRITIGNNHEQQGYPKWGGKDAPWPDSNLYGQTTPTGGNETRPKNIYVNWIIKAR